MMMRLDDKVRDSLIDSRAYSTWYNRPSGEKIVLYQGRHEVESDEGSACAFINLN